MAKLTGIATWNFSEGSLCERIENIVAMGYNAISLSARDARALAERRSSNPALGNVL